MFSIYYQYYCIISVLFWFIIVIILKTYLVIYTHMFGCILLQLNIIYDYI